MSATDGNFYQVPTFMKFKCCVKNTFISELAATGKGNHRFFAGRVVVFIRVIGV